MGRLSLESPLEHNACIYIVEQNRYQMTKATSAVEGSRFYGLTNILATRGHSRESLLYPFSLQMPFDGHRHGIACCASPAQHIFTFKSFFCTRVVNIFRFSSIFCINSKVHGRSRWWLALVV